MPFWKEILNKKKTEHQLEIKLRQNKTKRKTQIIYEWV